MFVEGALRLAGYGYPTQFFRRATVAGRDVLIENDKFGWRFFPPAIARSPTPTLLNAAKPPGTYRIFLFGESAALGDPRPAYGFGRYLEVLLNARFPGNRFEVVCAAMTAINSHALAPLARECARLDGDLWVVYMGNNEMEGPFGVATPFGLRAPSVGLVRLVLGLKATRVGQWAAALVSRGGGSETNFHSWAGMKTMAQQLIPPRSPAKRAVYRNFERNLDDILRTGERAGVPILLSTLACNLRECAPFATFPAPELPEPTRSELAELRSLAQAAATNRSFAAAITSYVGALALDPENAELHFRLGHAWLGVTNADEARRAFDSARDCDALPFRADSRFNDLIRQAAANHNSRGVSLFDADAVLSADAEGRSPGSEAFFEHVHLNFSGNYRLARALGERIETLLPPELQAAQRSEWLDEATCARRLGLTDWNRFAVLESVLQRMQDAPFTNQLGNPSRLRAMQAELIRLKSEMQPRNFFDARAIYDEALVISSNDFRLRENYAEFLEATGEYAEARTQWERVRDLIPHHVLAYYHLARMQTRLGELDPAAQNLAHALALRPDFAEARLALGQNLARQGKLDAAVAEYRAVLASQPGHPAAHLRLADALAAQGKRPEAVASLQEAVAFHPTHWEARYFLGVELVVDEKIPEASAQFAEVVRLRPDFPLGHLNYGVALAKLGDLKQAHAHFRATLRLDPENTKATEYLNTIESAARSGSTPPSPTPTP